MMYARPILNIKDMQNIIIEIKKNIDMVQHWVILLVMLYQRG